MSSKPPTHDRRRILWNRGTRVDPSARAEWLARLELLDQPPAPPELREPPRLGRDERCRIAADLVARLGPVRAVALLLDFFPDWFDDLRP